MSKYKSKRIGQILFEKGYISRPQLNFAYAIQVTRNQKMLIGQILLELDYITKAELEEAIEIQRKMKKTAKVKAEHHISKD